MEESKMAPSPPTHPRSHTPQRWSRRWNVVPSQVPRREPSPAGWSDASPRVATTTPMPVENLDLYSMD